MSEVSDIFSDDNVARANAYVRHLQQNLNIANADHIALWLEEHLDDDTGIGWLACRIVEAHEDATRALSAEVEALRWQPLETAPYSTPVRVKVGGMTLLASLEPNASMSEMDTACDQWQAVNEGEHPPCWTDGACWESNDNGDCSLQPEAWMYDPAMIAAAREE